MNNLHAKFLEYDKQLKHKEFLERSIYEKKNKEKLKLLIDQRNLEDALKLHTKINDDYLRGKFEDFVILEVEKSIKFANIDRLKKIVSNLECESDTKLKVRGKIFAYVYDAVKNESLCAYLEKMSDFMKHFDTLEGFSRFFTQITDEKINEYTRKRPDNTSVAIDNWLETIIECKKFGIGGFKAFDDIYFDMEKKYLQRCVDEGIYHNNKLEIQNKIEKRIGKHENLRKEIELVYAQIEFNKQNNC